MPAVGARQDPSRVQISCSECKRRKQKCSREWPCSHCQARHVPHLCQFTPLTASSGDISSTPNKSDVVKDAVPGIHEKSVNFSDAGSPQSLDFDRVCTTSQTGLYTCNNEAMDRALEIVLPRPYTDLLVKSFLDSANFHYYIIDPPWFLDLYRRWWVDRALRRRVTPELTCLILRVCSCSLQYLDRSTQQRLEQELGSLTQDLTERYHHAAQELSRSIPASGGGICHVQQLLLGTYWLKSEAKSVASWHALGDTIRAAQELDLRDTAGAEAVTEFEHDLRRRTWCILYTWDWQMSTLLSRPRIITVKGSSFALPRLDLEGTIRGMCPPSPITPMVLHCHLLQLLSKEVDMDCGLLSVSDTKIYRDVLQIWLENLPAIFKIRQPDTQFDATHKYLPLQRMQLHATAYAMMLHPLKQYLTRPVSATATSLEKELYSAAIDTSLSLETSLRDFFGLLFPLNAKFHSISCGVFDTAATLCLAIVYDAELHCLPRREEAISSIAKAMGILDKISTAGNSKIIAHSVLQSLVSNLPLSASESMVLGCSRSKRARLSQSHEQATTRTTDEPNRNVPPGRDVQVMVKTGHNSDSSTSPQPRTKATSMISGIDQLFEDFGGDLKELDSFIDWESINSELLAPAE